MAAQPNKIGVFDSGIGGLSVLREIHRLLPSCPTVFVADQAHLPYGPRPVGQIRLYVQAVTRFLIDQGCAVIVLACNTASAAALYFLRDQFPGLPIVGMEPAVKPAAERSRSGVIGVLSTQATADGELYRRVRERHAAGTQVITVVAPELVRIAEEQSQYTPASQAIIADYLRPLIQAQADEIVLACTHFPFIAEAIQQQVGPDAHLIDPAPAVARQVARVWPPGLQPSSEPSQYFTTASPDELQSMLHRLLGIAAPVHALSWSAGDTTLVATPLP